MNIIFDVYDPMTLKKNNFTKIMRPRVVDLKCALFGELPENFITEEDQLKGLKSISEFNESQKEDEDDSLKPKPEKQAEVQMVVVSGKPEDEPKKKEFVIDFAELEEETQEVVQVEVNNEHLGESRQRQASANPFLNNDSLLRNMTPPKHALNKSGKSQGSDNLYEVINTGHRFKMSINSSSSGYSKENMTLDLTPDKPATSSIDYLNSSEKVQRHSEFRNSKLCVNNLDFSVNSRPSFLDRNPRPRLSKENGQNWDCLSINTADLINSEGVSVLSDTEKQGFMEEIMEMDLDPENKHLLVELLREKNRKEAELMVSVLKKMPWVFDETLRRRKKELIGRKMERKQQRRMSKNEEEMQAKWNGKREVSTKFAIQLVSLISNLWTLKFENLNWVILGKDFPVKCLSLYREFGMNNLLHSRLTALLKNLLSFLLKES